MKYDNLKNALERYALENDGSLFTEELYVELLKFTKYIVNKDIKGWDKQFTDDEYMEITNEYLWKGLKKYNPEKLNGGDVLTFSRIVIVNGFKMYLRRENYANKLFGPNLETILTTDHDGNELSIMDTLMDETAYDDFEFEYLYNKAQEEIDKYMEEHKTEMFGTLSRDFKNIMKLRAEGKTCREIAELYNVGTSAVSRVLRRFEPRIKDRLKNKGIL